MGSYYFGMFVFEVIIEIDTLVVKPLVEEIDCFSPLDFGKFSFILDSGGCDVSKDVDEG